MATLREIELMQSLERRDARILELERDAARYRWLRSRMVGAHFNFDDEGMCVLAFEIPDTASVSADCDATIDAAMLAGEK